MEIYCCCCRSAIQLCMEFTNALCVCECVLIRFFPRGYYGANDGLGSRRYIWVIFY